ncbi:MAG: PD-(D/E)XK nuclease family protein, partial [Verrucomicrobiota bacterium]
MEIDAKAKTLTLSVGEFASFAPYSPKRPSNFTGIWRAQVGQQWHSKIQKRSDEQGEGFTNEAPIEGAILWRGWKILLNGRIDQLRQTADQLHVREIKTTTQSLPLPERIIQRDYPDYLLQLLAYRELLLANAAAAPSSQTLELLFIEIETGLSQTLTLNATHDTLLADHLDLLTDYLDAKLDRLSRLANLKDVTAYATLRPGQETIQSDLHSAFSKSPVASLEAPTGYGKTGVAWEYAFHQLATGQVERVIYLTSKSTGQLEAVKRLDALLPDDSKAAYWQILNKREHCIHHEFRCSPITCPYLADLDEKWKTSGLQRLYLLNQHPIELEDLKRESLAAAICPYETMKAALGFRDLWIADYNCLLSPSGSGLLAEPPDDAAHQTRRGVD